MDIIVKDAAGRVLSIEEVRELFMVGNNPSGMPNSIIQIKEKDFDAFNEIVTNAGCTVEGR